MNLNFIQNGEEKRKKSSHKHETNGSGCAKASDTAASTVDSRQFWTWKDLFLDGNWIWNSLIDSQNVKRWSLFLEKNHWYGVFESTVAWLQRMRCFIGKHVGSRVGNCLQLILDIPWWFPRFLFNRLTWIELTGGWNFPPSKANSFREEKFLSRNLKWQKFPLNVQDDLSILMDL